MDAIARVENRIYEMQSRFARMAGQTSAAPTLRSVASTSAATQPADSATSTGSFREVAAAVRTGTSATSSARSGYGINSDGSSVSTSVKSPGSYGAITLPRSLAGLRNGELPDSVLAPIGTGGHRLERTAAVAFQRMTTAAARDGVDLRVSDSYRSLADQETTADAVGLYRDGGRAAVPGTSTHGWGLSVDIDLDNRAQRWLRTNANRFGFAEDVTREPWHYTYRPADI
jgi:hypothetical protein